MMTTRRTALAAGIACILTLMVGAPVSAADARTAEPFKIGTCDWSIQMPLSVEAFHFAKRTELRGIQYSFDVAGEGLDLRLRENRDTIRQAVQDTGVAITSLGIGILNKIPFATTDEAEQLVIECIETMVKLKEEAAALEDRELAAKVAPEIVLLAFFGQADINGNPERIATVIEKLKRIAPLAEQHGITLALETLLNEADHRHILERVDSPAVKVFYDTGNSAKMGYDIYHEIQSLGTENICQIHIKENKALLGEGDIDFNRVKSILQSIEYKGWVIIEGSTPKGMSREEGCEINAVYVHTRFNQ